MSKKFYGDDWRAVVYHPNEVSSQKYGKTQPGCSCQFGCFRFLVEFVALVIICNIIGCEWAENVTERSVKYVQKLMSE